MTTMRERQSLDRHLEQCFRTYWPEIATTGKAAPNAVQTVNYCHCVRVEHRDDMVYDATAARRPHLHIR